MKKCYFCKKEAVIEGVGICLPGSFGGTDYDFCVSCFESKTIQQLIDMIWEGVSVPTDYSGAD